MTPLTPAEQVLVDQCVERWASFTEVRVTPKARARPIVPIALAARMNSREQYNDNLFLEESWLSDFQASRTHAAGPELADEYTSIVLDAMTRVEIVAWLQLWLFEAGYTFTNLLPVIENPRAQLNQIPRHIFVDWAITAKCCLADEIRGWSACRPVKSDGSVTPLRSSVRPEVAVRPKKAVARVQRTPVQETRPYDPYAYREAQSQSSEESSLNHDEQEESEPEAVPHSGRVARRNVQDPDVERLVTRLRKLPLKKGGSGVRRAAGNHFGIPPMPYIEVAPRHLPVSPADDPMTGGYAPPDAPSQQRRAHQPPAVATPMPLQGQHQAPRQGWYVPTSQQGVYTHYPPAPPVVDYPPIRSAAPYVPVSSIETFDGSERTSVAKGWLREFESMAATGQWTDEQKCSNLRLKLIKGAGAWLSQLGAERKKWKSVRELFRAEFCKSTESKEDLYFHMENARGESPRVFLYRLNAAAAKARYRLDKHENLQAHVSRFAQRVRDPTVRALVAAENFRTIDEVVVRLKRYEKNMSVGSVFEDRHRDRDRERSDKSHRERSMERLVRKEDDRKPARAALAYRAYESEYAGNECGRHQSPPPRVHFESENEDDSEGEQVYRAFGEQDRKRSRDWNADRPRNDQRDRSDRPCYVCNKTGHWSPECPDRDKSQDHSRVSCVACGSLGHDESKCWKKCKACGKVHSMNDECEVAKQLQELKAWYKANGSAGCATPLPANIVAALN